MAQQTAVKWFIEQLPTRIVNMYHKEIEQAKQMEKEQIKEGYIMSLLDGDNKIRRDAEQYYNETYNK